MFQVNIFTLYPEFFPGLLDAGNYRRARVNKIWDFNIVNLREFTGSNQRADDKPFGGGSGMVIRAEVISKALNKYKNGFEKVYYLCKFNFIYYNNLRPTDKIYCLYRFI